MKPVHAVFLNPYSNGGKGAARWSALLQSEAARERALSEAAVYDGAPEGAAAWAADQLSRGARHFLAAGGDGTVNLAAEALLAARAKTGIREAVLGAAALGSSNDFHKPHTGPGRAAASGLRVRMNFEGAFAHDVGRVSLDGSRTRHFVINASVGVTAEANAGFNNAGPLLSALKRRWVDGAILVTALKTFAGYRNLRLELQLGDSPARALALTNLGVTKNPNFSGGMRYKDSQPADDGLFGVYVCEGVGKLGLVRTLVSLHQGRFSGLKGASETSAPAVTVQGSVPFAVETDGEVANARLASFSVLKQELNLCP